MITVVREALLALQFTQMLHPVLEIILQAADIGFLTSRDAFISQCADTVRRPGVVVSVLAQ